MPTAFCSSLLSDGIQASSLVPVLDPASPNAVTIYRLFIIVLLICLAIFVAVVALIVISLVRSRATNMETPKQVFGSGRSEVVWAMPPALIVLGLGLVSAKLIFSITVLPTREISESGDADVVAVGHQWWWEVRYPAARAVAANEIHVQVGRKLRVQVDSADVIHSFWLPQLGVKIDMIPGQHNFVWLEADSPGVYEGACSEFCGDQHAWMRFIVVAETEPEYQTWLDRQAQPADGPVGADAQAGRQFFFTQTCINCHAVGGTSAVANAGPDLTHFAGRRLLAAGVIPNTPEYLARWLHDPQQIKPGCQMPNFNLNQKQSNQLVAYLEGLR